MRRRRRYNRHHYTYKPVSLGLAPETKKGISIILLLAFGVFSILSFFGAAGQAGRILDNALSLVFGSLRLLFGLAVVILTPFLYLSRLKILNFAGLLLFFLAFGGFIHLILFHRSDIFSAAELGQGGGYAGLLLSYPLLRYTGLPGGILISLALFILSLFFIFNTPLETFLKIIKIVPLILFEFFRQIYKLILSLKNKNFTPFIKKEIPPSAAEKSSSDETWQNENLEGDILPSAEFLPGQKKLAKKPRTKIEIPLTLLNKKLEKPTAGDIKANINIIQKTLANFGIEVEMGAYSVGPTVTQYTLKPADGIRLSRITALSNDLALALAAHPIRIEAPIPGKSAIGIEVPNQNVATVNLRDLLESGEFKKRTTNLSLALGQDVAGRVWLTDLGKMPHLLVAGSTGSGKSVCLNSIILSLIFSNSPDDIKFILVDPKRVEFPVYNGVPHLLTPVITDVKKTINALRWAIGEMERRFDLLSAANKRDIASYNNSAAESFPYIMIIIDELADLMAAAGAEIEACIIRLAQMSRAVGIHLIVATQRPSVDIITGLIKANITSRIAFAVGSIVDSRTILDSAGAEKLLGRGDMLFVTSDLSKPKRLQGAYVGEDDLRRIVNFLKENYNDPLYNESVLEKQKNQTLPGLSLDADEDDPLLDEALEVILAAGKASASLLQRRLSLGYARAARILDILERQGIIGPAFGAKPREILKKEFDKNNETEN